MVATGDPVMFLYTRKGGSAHNSILWVARSFLNDLEFTSESLKMHEDWYFPSKVAWEEFIALIISKLRI